LWRRCPPLVRFPREPGKRREDRGKGPPAWSRPGFRVGIYTFLVYSMPTAVLLTFGGIFAREAFHAPYWLITPISKRQTSPFRAG